MSAAELIAGNIGAPYGNRMPGHLVCEALNSGRFPEADQPEWGALFTETPLERIIRAANECGAELTSVAHLYREHLAVGGAHRKDIEDLLERWANGKSAPIETRTKCPDGWKPLLRRANAFITEVESTCRQGRMNPILGGGVRLAIELEHRVPNNLDLFLDDPTWLRELSSQPSRWGERLQGLTEESNRVTIRFPEGEVRFVVAPRLLELPPPTFDAALGFHLEHMQEVLAKKLFYRGATLRTVDVFDWYAIASLAPDPLGQQAVAHLVRSRLNDIAKSLDRIGSSDSDQAEWEAIETHLPMSLAESVDWAKQRLEDCAALSRR